MLQTYLAERNSWFCRLLHAFLSYNVSRTKYKLLAILRVWSSIIVRINYLTKYESPLGVVGGLDEELPEYAIHLPFFLNALFGQYWGYLWVSFWQHLFYLLPPFLESFEEKSISVNFLAPIFYAQNWPLMRMRRWAIHLSAFMSSLVYLLFLTNQHR